MTDLVRLPATARRRQAWKNGLGVTTEILASPSGSGFDDFDWRISIAEITRAGAFSTFDGVDRVLTILDGTLALTRGADTLQLDPASAPLAFSGDVPVTATPGTALVRDLNVMTRRGRARATVERVTVTVARDLPATSLLIAPQPLTIEIAGRSIELAALDAVFLAATAPLAAPASPPAPLILVSLMREG